MSQWPPPYEYAGPTSGDIVPILGQKKKEDLPWLKPRLISDLTTIQPRQILRGMLYKGCKMALMGGSKSYKTWAQMDMAYCVANGFLWWGVHVEQVSVVYLDFELLDYDFRWRMEQIHLAHIAMGDKGGSMDAVKRIGLRNRVIEDSYWEYIHEYILEEKAGFTLCDPTYKLLQGRDENKAGDIAQVTALFDRLTEATGSALTYAQHFSKGNQANKESIDRGAGSGVWARDADTIVTMTAHKEGNDCLAIEMTLRSFPRIDPFVVRWNNPLFKREPTLDPEDLKQRNQGGRPKDDNDDVIMAAWRALEPDGGGSVTQIVAATMLPRRSIYRAIKERLNPSRLVKSVGKSGYQLSLPEAKAMHAFVAEQNSKPEEKEEV